MHDDAEMESVMAAGRKWLPWAMWGLGASCYLLALFHRMSLSVAGLTAQERFGVDATGMAAFVAVQLALYAALQIPVGTAADRVGPRRMILLGMALMAGGSVVFAVAGSYGVAVAGRALIGAGDALMFVNVLRLAHNWFPGPRYALVAALTGMIGGLGQLVATAPLGALLEAFGWTPAFLTAGVLTAGLATVVVVGLRERPAEASAAGESRSRQRRVNWLTEPLRQFIRTKGSVSQAPTEREPLPTLLRQVWHEPGTRHALWTHFTLMGTFVSVTAVLGQPYLVGAHGLSSEVAGTLLAAVVVGFVTGSTAAGQLASRRPRARGPLVLSAATVVTASSAALVLLPGSTPVPVLAPVLFALGAGGGVSMVAFDLARTANVPCRAGIATGMVNVGGFSFAVAAQLGVGLLLDALLASGLEPASAHRLAFAVIVTMSATGTRLVVRYRRHAGRRRPEQVESPSRRDLVPA